MGLLPALASLVGIEVDELLARLRENAVAWTAIAVFAGIAVVFLLIAADTALTGWVGPMWSPLIIAGAALVVALILFIVLKIQNRAMARRKAERRHQEETTALVAAAALASLPEVLKSPIVRNVGIPLALYAGYLFFAGRHSTQKKP